MDAERNPTERDAMRGAMRIIYAKELGAKDAEIAQLGGQLAQKDGQLAQLGGELAQKVARALIQGIALARGWELSESQTRALQAASLDELRTLRDRAIAAKLPDELFELGD